MTHRQVARPYVVAWPDGRARSRVDLSLVVEQVTVQKSLASPVGTFSMTLAPSLARPYGSASRTSYRVSDPHMLEQVLRPQSLVSIGMDEPGGLGLFLVDSVERRQSFSGGRVNDTLSVSGRDLGKTLEADHIVYANVIESVNPSFFRSIERVVGPEHALLTSFAKVWAPRKADGARVFDQATLQEVTDWLLSVSPSMTIPLLESIGGTGHLGDFITPLVSRGWNDGRIRADAPHPGEGSYLNFIRGVLDQDFYEVWLDSVPRRVVDPQSPHGDVPVVLLVIRPKPFDEPDLQFLPTTEQTGTSWADLRTMVTRTAGHRVVLDEVLSSSMGFTDADAYSYYLVTSEQEFIDNTTGTGQGLLNPTVDVFALKRFGVRAYQARLSLLSSDTYSKRQNADTTSLELFQTVDFRNRLFNWYRLNEFFEAGSVSVVGRDHYRVGDPLVLPWRQPLRATGLDPSDPMRYYVVSASSSWSFGSTYTTQLGLTRGHNRTLIHEARRQISAAAQQYGVEGMVATTISRPLPLLPPRVDGPQASGVRLPEAV